MMRNAKARIAALPILLILTGCQGRIAPPVTSNSDHVAPAVSAKKVLAVYEGLLPCADCQGIRTELTFFAEDSTYRLVETYLGTPEGDRTFSSSGEWTRLQGTAELRGAAIYQLNPDKPDEVRDFLIVNERQIRQLDREGREIESRLSYTLTRKTPPV